MNEFGLQNMVNDLMCIAYVNILDLILTSNPSIIIAIKQMPLITSLVQYLPKKVPYPQKSPLNLSQHPLLEIGIDGVIKQLKNLNQNKGTGPDELPARVLKETAEQIAPIITQMFQQSYDTGKLPIDWLQALVTPIYKKTQI